MSVEWHFLITLNEQLCTLKDPVEIQEVAVRLIGEHLRASRVHYAHIDGEEFVMGRSYVDGVQPLEGRGSLGRFSKAIVDACRRGETVVVDDVRADPRFTAAEREQLLAGETAAFVGTPLIKGGCWLGTFGVHSATSRSWTRDQVALVEVAAERMWAAAERARAEEALDRSDSRQAFLRRLNDTIRPLASPVRILEETCRLLGTHLRANRVAYGEVEGDDCIIVHDYVDGVTSMAGHLQWRNLAGSRMGEILKGGPLAVNDTSTESHTAEERAALEAAGIRAYICPLLVKDGRFVGAFGVHSRSPRVWTSDEIALVQDVADRIWATLEYRKAEAELRANEERLALALKASAGGSWTWDLRTNDAHWDDTFRARFGFTPEEPPLFETWLGRVHVEDRLRMRRILEEVLQARETWDHTYRVLRPDGAVLWLQSLGRAERDATGQVTRLTGLELDITERRRVEDTLQAHREEEHDRTLRTLLETAMQGLVAADAHGVVVFANRAFEVMFGWAAEEVIGQPIERLIPWVFRDGTNPAGGLDLMGTRKDGSVFPIEVTVNHVPTRSGGRVFAFVTDITERQRAAMALQQRTTELEYRTTQLSQMAWDLTLAEHQAREQIARTLHDGLQQLLVIVALNLTQQLKRENEAGDAPSELLVEAKQQLDEAIAVARSLNIELFPPVLQRSGLPAALTWLAKWAQDKYKLRVEIGADPRADSGRKDIRTLLFESVRELLFNVVKYAQTDRVTLALALDADGQLCITVTDQGVGFDAARLDDRSNARQVGWGLFRIRERLTLLGGRLDIDSAPGRGTRVRLVAPRGAAQDTIMAANTVSFALTEAASAVGDTRASPDVLRILIVDDHPAIRLALRELLHQRPQLSVVGDASNGVEAIAHAYVLRPDVILMDVLMPHMDGVEATARIRTELPDIRILGMSMLARNDTADAIEQAGAAGFFVKGTDTQRLIDHLLAFHASRGAGDRAAL
jgi:PAS domain S-box-containing protein